MIILGISGTFSWATYNPAATLLIDGKIIAGCEEERFNRLKSSPHKLPIKSIEYVLKEANISMSDIDVFAYSVESYDDFESELKRHINLHFGLLPKIFKSVNHHIAHSASGYWGSGIDNCAVLSYDWSGDGICMMLSHGVNNKLNILDTKYTKDGYSLGRFYAAFTQYLGFEYGDEYKVMGLSSYGSREDLYDMTPFIQIHGDGYEINQNLYTQETFNSIEKKIFNESCISRFVVKQKTKSENISQEHFKLAISVQVAFEKALIVSVKNLKKLTNSDTVALVGGSALNCVANGILLKEKIFSNIYVPPIASDAGCSLGAAYYIASKEKEKPIEALSNPYLGPEFSNDEVKKWLVTLKIKYEYIDNIAKTAAQDIAKSKLVGWFQGRSEFGPRALGNRSILANPADKNIKDKINKYVKFRETFRPFAPSVIHEKAYKYFKNYTETPFMTLVFDLIDTESYPAITHVDGTGRVQSIHKDINPLYYNLVEELEKITGVAMVLNTSFNINTQPIVNTPHEAIYTFFSSGLDVLYIGNYRVEK